VPYVYVYVCVCVCMCVRIHIYIYIYIYIYIEANKKRLFQRASDEARYRGCWIRRDQTVAGRTEGGGGNPWGAIGRAFFGGCEWAYTGLSICLAPESTQNGYVKARSEKE